MTELNRAQKQIQKAAADFAKGEFDKDLALTLENENRFPEDIWKKAADLGFIGVHFPEAHMGGGMGLLETCLVWEAFCRRDSSIGSALATSASGAECLLRFGDEAVCKRFLPGIAEARIRSAYGFFEDGVGPDLADVQTVARKKDGHWIVNGAKSMVANGGVAGVYVILCCSDSDMPADRKLSMFVVESDRTGITPVDAGRKLGANMVSTADLAFTDVRIPADHLLGQEGHGLAQADRFLEEAALLTAAQCTGMAAGAFDRALVYAKEREQFGRRLVAFEITRQKIADMALKVEQARSMTHQAARCLDAGKAMARTGTMARLVAARAAVEVADEAIQLLGGYGYMKESGVERIFRDAKAADLSLGGMIHLKNKIAGEVIGSRR
jgi:alkylation response protein AidB-like acyl-CoA dehydrogenase